MHVETRKQRKTEPVYGGPDWTKINNLVFIDLVLHYGQKDLDFEKDEPTKKRPPFKEISAP